MVINMKIGYCPTMKKYLINFFENKDLELINLGSARQVLFLLDNNKIDVGVIGRQAKKSEFEGVLKRIGTGYTLITTTKSMISNNDLEMLEIHTSISKEIIKEKYPYLKNVVYHDSLKDALSKGRVHLISWDDWDDDFGRIDEVLGLGYEGVVESVAGLVERLKSEDWLPRLLSASISLILRSF